MNDLQRILVVQDSYSESIKALNFADQLATSETDLSVIDVQPPLSAFWHDLIDDDFEQSPSVHRHKNLRELVRGVDFGEAKVTTTVKRGRPVIQVVKKVLADDIQLVVKEANSKISNYLFGSIDFRLVRYCPAPVLLLHPRGVPKPDRILVAINPEAIESEVELNRQLIHTASTFANQFNCKLGVVAAYQTPRSLGHVADAEFLRRFEKGEKEYRRKCRAALDEILQSSQRPVKPEYVFIYSGRPSEVIANVVDEFEPDLLVIGSVARQGLNGLLIGNTAERVLRFVDCSVLTIKPAEFECPIE